MGASSPHSPPTPHCPRPAGTASSSSWTKLDKIGWDGVRTELDSLGLPAIATTRALEIIDRLQEVPAGKLIDTVADALPCLDIAVLDDLAATMGSLDRLGEQRRAGWCFDPTLVRGMGYYTGQIFEISHSGMSSSVAAGGPYDNLIGRTVGRDAPACGFSIGFERIIGLVQDTGTRSAVAVLAEADVPVADVLAVARGLRSSDRIVEIVPRSGKLAAQLKRLEAAQFGSYVAVRTDGGNLAIEDERHLGGPRPGRA
ncbi:ATP phosphoribosyltransferase regulatory subunit [Nocardia sp. R6R-6]|uniref:ATP phosphoribosyltransferase regulatory subunit n=1 Tax=Nocardia sp. R6R-6 TaxID=3459303 RepID=UPI00403DCE80